MAEVPANLAEKIAHKISYNQLSLLDEKHKWRILDCIKRSKQTWWLLISKNHPLWSQLPPELIVNIQQFISCMNIPALVDCRLDDFDLDEVVYRIMNARY